ncbi:unnamed protein product [Pylaiella littoralis]
MARMLTTRAALAVTATVVILLLLATIVFDSRALSTGDRTNAGVGGGRPEPRGSEVGFIPGVVLPNLARKGRSAKRVRPESGTRSAFYGDIQRQHQEWLLRRAQEVGSAAGVKGRSGRRTTDVAASGGSGRAERENKAEREDRDLHEDDGADDTADAVVVATDVQVGLVTGEADVKGEADAAADQEGGGGGGAGTGVERGTRSDGAATASSGGEEETSGRRTAGKENNRGGRLGKRGGGLESGGLTGLATPATVGDAAGEAAGDAGAVATINPKPEERRRRLRSQGEEEEEEEEKADPPQRKRRQLRKQPTRRAAAVTVPAAEFDEWESSTKRDTGGDEVLTTTAAAATTTKTITTTTPSPPLPPPTAPTTTPAPKRRRTGAGTDSSRKDRPGPEQTEGRLMTATNDAEEERRERVRRLERGAELWGGTYAPPIEPERRRDLIEKWSARREGNDGERDGGKEKRPSVGAGDHHHHQQQQQQQHLRRDEGRVLYVISSFDRGKRLGQFYQHVDKVDYILMMMDEMREACELGFSPEIHLIAAWDPSEVSSLVRDRLFCTRTGEHVPYTYEEHPPSIRNNLAIQHRIYMRERLQQFDVFLQVEDDMVLTLNHILLYLEECDVLENRTAVSLRAPSVFVPGFIRVESGGDVEGHEGWFEWEIVLSRLFPINVDGAGTYMALRPSRVLKRAGNNQGLWMATRDQLKLMAKRTRCRYLDFDENSTNGMPETHGGSLQMFSPECGFEKVFPATHFEDFAVHHRTNNKNGRMGESIPGVSMAMLRLWAEQFIRDKDYLRVVRNSVIEKAT